MIIVKPQLHVMSCFSLFVNLFWSYMWLLVMLPHCWLVVCLVGEREILGFRDKFTTKSGVGALQEGCVVLGPSHL